MEGRSSFLTRIISIQKVFLKTTNTQAFFSFFFFFLKHFGHLFSFKYVDTNLLKKRSKNILLFIIYKHYFSHFLFSQYFELKVKKTKSNIIFKNATNEEIYQGSNQQNNPINLDLLQQQFFIIHINISLQNKKIHQQKTQKPFYSLFPRKEKSAIRTSIVPSVELTNYYSHYHHHHHRAYN